MRTLTIIIAGAALLFASCAKLGDPNQQITTGVSIGTRLVFEYALKGDQRTTIANYVSGVAGTARTFTGNETPEQITQAITARIPASVLEQFPEISVAIIQPVVSYYVQAKAQFGAGTTGFLERMNAVATGLEAGVAAYITKT